MIVVSFPSGPFATNAYLIACPETLDAAIVDPSPDSAEALSRYLQEHQLTLKMILLTHSHWDHIADVAVLKDRYAVPYFERWMEQFPSVATLASAPIDAVIKAWEGLGYYSRARNLHAGAKMIMTEFNGQLPNDHTALKSIKGLGPYTIGAILSFAFHQKISAVDGNVIRVLSRLFMIEDDISKPKTIKQLTVIAEEILPDADHWVVNEALIELGAKVCTRQPKCLLCPLKQTCCAYRQGAVNRLPYKSRRIAIEQLERAVMVVQSGEFLLVQRRKKGEIMSDLYEFPFFEIPHSNTFSLQEALHHHIQTNLGIAAQFVAALPEVTHSFTRYRARLHPTLFSTAELPHIPDYEWMHISKTTNVAFSSGHKKILASAIK